MASFFGEVLPVNSRYGDDDEAEADGFANIAKSSPVIVRWTPEIRAEIAEKKTIQCTQLVVAIGQCGKAFKHLQVQQDLVKIGTILNGVYHTGSLSQSGRDDDSCYIYRTTGKNRVCLVLCSTNVSDVQSLPWCNALLESFNKSVRIIIASTSHVSEYKTNCPPSELNVPFIALLQTSHWTDKSDVTFLPQPNIITGLAAQLLTLCQVSHRPAAVFHLYRETLFMDNVALAGFKKLLACLPNTGLESKIDINIDSNLIREESLYI